MYDRFRINSALRFATRAHLGQKRKYNNKPYISHPIEVARVVSTVDHSEEMLMAALLHDVVEDTPVTLEEVTRRFGEVVGDYVRFLTDVSVPEDGNRALRKRMDAEHYARGPAESQTIKVADLMHNTSDIKVQDPAFWKLYRVEKQYSLSLLTKADPLLIQQAMSQLS
jgi:(p)ppGpp synthase/HD superfamily hydrolase|tara:strand:+ start:6538 stop:7041 length:504 start_codon:yes stop_codon:yes gene_type:complete